MSSALSVVIHCDFKMAQSRKRLKKCSLSYQTYLNLSKFTLLWLCYRWLLDFPCLGLTLYQPITIMQLIKQNKKYYEIQHSKYTVYGGIKNFWIFRNKTICCLILCTNCVDKKLIMVITRDRIIGQLYNFIACFKSYTTKLSSKVN